MTPQERYQKVKQIVYQAMELKADKRQEFVVEACKNDTSMIQEVNNLLEEDSEIRFSKMLHNKIAKESSFIVKAMGPNKNFGQTIKQNVSATKFATDLVNALLIRTKTINILIKKIKNTNILIRHRSINNNSLLIITLILAILVAELIFRIFSPYFNPSIKTLNNLHPSTLNSVNQIDTIELSYSITLQEIKNKKYSTPIPLAGQNVIFHNGDLIKLNLKSSSGGYLYVLNESPELVNGLPKYTLLFPAQDEMYFFEAKESITIPMDKEPGFLFTSPTGVEKIWLIYSKKKILVLEEIKSLLNQQDFGIVKNTKQITGIKAFLNKQAVQKVETDEETNQIKIKGDRDILITSLNLNHLK